MRLIDADALMKEWGLDKARKYGNFTRDEREFSYSMMSMYEIADMISDAPTIDAQPVQRGEWIEYTDWSGIIGQNRAVCSNCGFGKNGKPFTRGDGKGGKYCEECGAKMKRKDAEKCD